jgi:succinate-semialdehyde dehydrogenase/glutarate-semialdehyde dehydrogenase
MKSINPATGKVTASFSLAKPGDVEASLQSAQRAFVTWRGTTFAERAALLRGVAEQFRSRRAELAGLITVEMGKPIVEAEAEIEKCAWVAEYYAENAEAFLAAQPHPSSATESYVDFPPLGTVLAIMPWNFPFWQLMRFAAPALMAGNTGILKHASNVPQCALAAEDVFRQAGAPAGVFQALLLPGADASRLIADARIAAVTLTGSEEAGARVGEEAGRAIKKVVLELGGSDPFIVLEDADVAVAAETGVRARYQNAGQSCIAAKRFILVDQVFDEFCERFTKAVQALSVGDPMQRSTRVGPLARDDLRDDLERQLQSGVAAGARVLAGGKRLPGPGYFFEPTVVTDVARDSALAREEVFGPVAALMRVRDASEAIEVANDTPYGLGSSLWTRDLARARVLARDVQAGAVFVNGMVASDPRLPFGGVKTSGYGRELSEYGIREFVNVQAVWIGPVRKP